MNRKIATITTWKVYHKRQGCSIMNKQYLFFILYDGIYNSIFEGQVLEPLLKKIKNNNNLFIKIVSFEKKTIEKQYLENLNQRHKNLSVITYKKYFFIHSLSLLQPIRKLHKILKKHSQYTIIARGPFAGLITEKALTHSCHSYTLQARGLLEEEYLYTHKNDSHFIKFLHKIRGRQLRFYEKKAYTPTFNFPLIFKVESVSSALRDYLIREYFIDKSLFSIATDDIPKKICIQKKAIMRKRVRKELSIDQNYFVYVYNGSAKLWQCPEETVLFFKKKYHQNKKVFLLIISTDPNIFSFLCKKHELEKENYTIITTKHSSIQNYLCATDEGIILRECNTVNWVSRPTKYLEYKAALLTVHHNNTVAYIKEDR